MTGEEFIRKVRKLARRTGKPCTLTSTRGKGDHRTLSYGDAYTIVGDRGELKTGTLHAMLKQLGVTLDDLR
jgi:mRNA interferase HicA